MYEYEYEYEQEQEYEKEKEECRGVKSNAECGRRRR